ncbi:hypothetical protein HCN44_004607 [Aphidius gifuensis]|uniref:Box C/D snoRNA protein 1 n=1 Tax=Aphidius gifuensis TaxID=684658 RepID=A0A835CW69_APHGI|nr:hypothetical protein HCN44_004607 [Aphidius gifuensis]
MTTTSEEKDLKCENCEVCAAVKAKYTCPKCEVRTCSLTCAKIHKQSLPCDGIRDKVKFILKDNMTDLDILSDYRFLEEGNFKADLMRKERIQKFTNNKTPLVDLSTKLEFLPHNFTKHQDNTTHLNWETNELFWKIEWIFHQAENLKFITPKTLDTTRLSDLVEEILNSSSLTQENNSIKNIKLFHEKIKFYRATGLSGIRVLLKAENLDVTSSLRENLSKKTIIEYPTIYLVLKDHSDMYEIIDSDEDLEDEEMPTQQHQQRRRKNISNVKNPI